jgi:hypothetical protein
VFRARRDPEDIASWTMTFETASRFVFTPDRCSVPGNETPSCYRRNGLSPPRGSSISLRARWRSPSRLHGTDGLYDFESPFYAPATNLKVRGHSDAGRGTRDPDREGLRRGARLAREPDGGRWPLGPS